VLGASQRWQVPIANSFSCVVVSSGQATEDQRKVNSGAAHLKGYADARLDQDLIVGARFESKNVTQ
jgi:hypothetical protein